MAERSGVVPGVEFDSVSVKIGRQRVLHDVSFSAGPGITCLVGNNGSGKSTVLRAAATLIPVHGTIRIGGHRTSTVVGVTAARRRLGYLSAEGGGAPQHTVEEAVTYAAWLQRVPRGRRTASVRDAISRVGLTSRRGERLGALSTGLRQRARLAQVLVHEPEVLLLDEPTSAVDPEHRTVVREILGALGADRTVLLSTHLGEDVEHAADQVVVLGDGSVRWSGSSADFLAVGDPLPADRGTASPFERSLGALVGR